MKLYGADRYELVEQYSVEMGRAAELLVEEIKSMSPQMPASQGSRH